MELGDCPADGVKEGGGAARDVGGGVEIHDFLDGEAVAGAEEFVIKKDEDDSAEEASFYQELNPKTTSCRSTPSHLPRFRGDFHTVQVGVGTADRTTRNNDYRTILTMKPTTKANCLGRSARLSSGLLSGALLFCLGSTFSSTALAGEPGRGSGDKLEAARASQEPALIQLAILLDTSGSMSGLIDQARCQVWNAISELSKASREGSASRLEISVYQYGSELLTEDVGFIRRVTDFTDDLDSVSKALFSLKVKGGEEFCGQVIDQALTELSWNPAPGVYKAIFIAGNESFDQGEITFGQALPKALDGDVVINSIYCFDPKSSGTAPKTTPGGATAGMEQWEAAARLTDGMYFQIDHNHHLPEMKTPYDAEMRKLNRRMNDTFIWFGEHAHNASGNQKMQDQNAADLSDHAFAARMSAKIGHLYHHVDHDLVDAIRHGAVKLDKMPPARMPERLQKMSPEMRREFVEGKIADRDRVRREMAEVISRRHAFLERKMSAEFAKQGQAPAVLGDALVNAVRVQARQRGFEFESAPGATVSIGQ